MFSSHDIRDLLDVWREKFSGNTKSLHKEHRCPNVCYVFIGLNQVLYLGFALKFEKRSIFLCFLYNYIFFISTQEFNQATQSIENSKIINNINKIYKNNNMENNKY